MQLIPAKYYCAAAFCTFVMNRNLGLKIAACLTPIARDLLTSFSRSANSAFH